MFAGRIGGVEGKMPDTWEGGDVVYSEEPVLGFRAWRGNFVGGLPYLLPMYCDYPPWPHYERMEAMCPHWLKANPSEDARLRSGSVGQFSQFQRARSVVGSYSTHARYLDHPADVPPPYYGCSCGLYHTDRLAQVTNTSSTLYGSSLQGAKGLQEGTTVAVVGSCRLWGRMVRHEKGWRAQYAYPEHLFILKPDNTPNPLTDGPHPLDVEENRRTNLIDWRQALEVSYGVPVGFCERKDFESLGSALED